MGNKIAPAYADYVLARDGYESQQLNAPEEPDRPNNLWEPVPGDHGAHGAFDSRAHDWSPEWFVAKHRRWFAPAALLLGLAGAAWCGKKWEE